MALVIGGRSLGFLRESGLLASRTIGSLASLGSGLGSETPGHQNPLGAPTSGSPQPDPGRTQARSAVTR